MLRSVLERRTEVQENSTTPLRGGDVGFPRIRLADKHSKLSSIPIYALSPTRSSSGRSSSLQDKNPALRAYNWPPQHYQHRRSSTADRFIPQRRHRSLDAMNYNLTHVSPSDDQPGYFDLYGQIVSLETTWRKKLMKKAIDRADVIPGMKDRRVLNFAERENQRSIPDVTVKHDLLEDMRKSKARYKPLVDHASFTIKLERTRRNWPESIDWGSRNFLATVIENLTDSSVVIFNADVNNTGTITRPVRTIVELHNRIQAIKWNHAGDRIALVTHSSKLKVHSIEKHCWSRNCPCVFESLGKRCNAVRVAWTHSDKEIAICCRENRITAFTYSGELIQSQLAEFTDDSIISISFSSNDRYLALTSFDTIRVYTWPCLTSYLIFTPALSEHLKSIAWHPWNANVLCVGGCPVPNALSLWDVHRQTLIESKRAVLVERVDEIAWNKLSGELVVRWGFWDEDQWKSEVAVHVSLDRVVDSFNEKSQTSGLVWNPDSTLLATRRKNQVKIWKFFGDEAKKWIDSEQKDEKARIKMESLSRRRAVYTDQTKHLEHYNIH